MATIRHIKNVIAMFMAIFSLIFVVSSVQGIYVDFERQLKIINKPAIKSFQTEYGDIIDCVDIYKQLAFDHPMLKHHKIQMKPKIIPKDFGNEASKDYKSSDYIFENITCPPESVPIKRATREDLIVAESLKYLGLNHLTNTLSRRKNAVEIQGHESAMLVFEHQNYGSRAILNVWNPVVQDQQFSLGSMGLATGPVEKINTIQAGWLVHSVISPNASIFFTFWTGNGYQSGCYNTLCPGFVQVSPQIAPGLVIRPSIYNSSQTEMFFSLYQDRATLNWWLMVDDKYIGYWPKELLPNMENGAQIVSWGGEVYSPVKMFSPAMGSGHFPEEGYSKSTYIHQIKVIRGDRETNATQYLDPMEYALRLWVNKPYCYNAMFNVSQSLPWGVNMFFGGPGNCTF